MSENETFPVRGMRIQIEIHLDATPEQVFNALTTGVALWWDAKHLESKKLARDLILEPRLGGRFYETWEDPPTDKDGALLGNVIQIHKWQIIKIAGYFGLEEHCAHGVVSIRLVRCKTGTNLRFQHDAVGELSDGLICKTRTAWHDLLNSLKKQVEEQHSSGLRVDPAFDYS
jgi:uncharacterized protein YndB with AHSA1/START domain